MTDIRSMMRDLLASREAPVGQGPSDMPPANGASERLDDDAIRRCRETLAAHSKSFAMASRVFEPAVRDRAAVIYSFCRHTDDAIDLAPKGERAQALDGLRQTLDSIYQGEAQTDITLAAFQAVVRRFRIPRGYPEELLAGMEMDVLGTHYRTVDQLLLYCFRVAGTVGLMMCHAMGIKHERFLENAVHMGIAMQLTNICRDVLEDWHLGRLYLPDELLAEYGLGELRARLGQPFPEDARIGVAAVVESLLTDAARYYASGDRGLVGLPWRCALAVRAARMIYAAIGDRIAAQGYDVTRGRAVVPSAEKVRLLALASGAALTEIPPRAVARVARRGSAHIPRVELRFPEDVALPPG